MSVDSSVKLPVNLIVGDGHGASVTSVLSSGIVDRLGSVWAVLLVFDICTSTGVTIFVFGCDCSSQVFVGAKGEWRFC